MPRLIITTPITSQILPEDCISRYRLEHHPFLRPQSHPILLSGVISIQILTHLRAFDPLTPSPISWPPQPGKASTTASPVAVPLNVNHKTTNPIPQACSCPIKVMNIMSSLRIALYLQRLDEQILPPALQGPRSLSYTSDRIIGMIQRRNSRETDSGVMRRRIGARRSMRGFEIILTARTHTHIPISSIRFLETQRTDPYLISKR